MFLEFENSQFPKAYHCFLGPKGIPYKSMLGEFPQEYHCLQLMFRREQEYVGRVKEGSHGLASMWPTLTSMVTSIS
jgi:hypothetical protein